MTTRRNSLWREELWVQHLSRRLGLLSAGTAAVVLVVGVFYFWTAATSPDSGRSYHSMLAEGFQHGTTALPEEPAPELKALPDPYDPVANAEYRLHDASYYEGEYYLYFGPTPAAVLFLPLRLVGVDIDDRVAAPLLATAGFAAAAILLLVLIGRFAPRTSTGWRLVAVAGIGLCNVIPFMLRRPQVYETSIAAGYFFLMLSVLLLVVATMRETPALPIAALGSLALGLAVGARANMALVAPLLVWVAWRLAGPRSGWTRRGIARTLAAVMGPFAVCLLLLGLYNVVRFGSPTEFGVSYQLSSLTNPQEADYFSLDRLMPGAWFYLLQPPDLSLDFPFITLRPDYPGDLPDGFFVEPVAGVLAVSPLIAMLAVVPVLIRRRRDADDRRLAELSAVLVGVALVLPVPALLTFGGATERYEVDFVTLLLIPATVTWLWLAANLGGSRTARRGILGLGLVAIALSASANLAFSMVGYGDGLRTAQPGTYERLEQAFSWIPTIAARIKDEPMLLEVRPRGISGDESEIQLVAPQSGLVTVKATLLPNPGLPAGSYFLADISVAGGPSTRVRLDSARPATLSVDVERGLTLVSIRWRGILIGDDRSESSVPPAGFGLSDARIVTWAPG